VLLVFFSVCFSYFRCHLWANMCSKLTKTFSCRREIARSHCKFVSILSDGW